MKTTKTTTTMTTLTRNVMEGRSGRGGSFRTDTPRPGIRGSSGAGLIWGSIAYSCGGEPFSRLQEPGIRGRDCTLGPPNRGVAGARPLLRRVPGADGGQVRQEGDADWTDQDRQSEQEEAHVDDEAQIQIRREEGTDVILFPYLQTLQ